MAALVVIYGINWRLLKICDHLNRFSKASSRTEENGMNPLKIYLCDLTHETVILVSDTIPVNIGYVGSYAKRMHGDTIDVILIQISPNSNRGH